ncbi:6106_t:CDS:2 [Acaulospora morrowiae]|uniref:6106_t:CDS:1 n=1 Tax=Acaulospora morrowiae TaxID=94023 RepID=A0A9N9AI47_9GLOM|nr:6106_t:CDS:2 [Acaulospora morrowiae]
MVERIDVFPFLSVGSFFFIGIYPGYNIISLILSAVYAYIDERSGPFMLCSLNNGDLCNGITETRELLRKGCEYHAKNVIISRSEERVDTL